MRELPVQDPWVRVQKSLRLLGVGVGQPWTPPGRNKRETLWWPPLRPRSLRGWAVGGWGRPRRPDSLLCLSLSLWHQALSLSTCEMVSLLWPLPTNARVSPQEGGCRRQRLAPRSLTLGAVPCTQLAPVASCICPAWPPHSVPWDKQLLGARHSVSPHQPWEVGTVGLLRHSFILQHSLGTCHASSTIPGVRAMNSV